MKLFWLTTFCTFTSVLAHSQEFSGVRTGNYTGVNGAFYNPANIADSRHKWQFNLVSFHTLVGNDNAAFKLSDLKNAADGDELENQLTGNGAGLTSGMVYTNIHGPSLMLTTGKKSSIAITTRARVLVNAIDIDGELAQRIIDEADGDDGSFDINSASRMRLNANAWSEFGFTYSRVLWEKGPHFLKGGVTVKYLAGAANAYLGLENLTGQVSEDIVSGDSYLSNATGRMQIGFGGLRLDDFEVSDLTSFKSSGIGADLGLVYEFRPESLNDGDVESNKYRFSVGLSLLDAGSINYRRDATRSGGYDINITGAERLNLQELEANDVDELKSYFDSRPQFFTQLPGNYAAKYKTSLPTSLNLDVDYRFGRRLYVNLYGMFSLTNSDSKVYNGHQFSSVTVTPRIESGSFGIYVPVQYHTLTSLNAGLSLRLGPLFLGSGSILTALAGESKQADFFMGLRFGALKKNKNKSRPASSDDIGL